MRYSEESQGSERHDLSASSSRVHGSETGLPIDHAPRERFDLTLPRLTAVVGPAITLEHLTNQFHFSGEDLIRAIVEPLVTSGIAKYLSVCDAGEVRCNVNTQYEGFASLFYAASGNDCKLVRLLVEMSVNPNSVGRYSVPILAWTILEDHLRSWKVVATVLGLGCDADTVPSNIYEDIVKNPEDSMGGAVTQRTRWFTLALEVVLAARLSLTHRYLLHTASKRKTLKPRKIQIAQRLKTSSLSSMPYLVVGQDVATDIVCSAVRGHLSLKSPHPLVIAFAGAPGHGKTELALQMGELLSAKSIVVDCTRLKCETDLFGAMYSYQG